MYNNALQEALQKLNNMGGKPQKSLKESSNGPDSREEAFKCIRKLCDDAALAVKDSDIRNAIDTVCSYGDNFIRIDLICLDGGSAPGHFALHIPNGDKQIVFLIKDEDNPKISSRWDVRSMGPSEIEFLETTRKNNDQLKFYHHEYQGIPARLSMDKKQEEGLKESKKINESKEEFGVIVEDGGGWIVDRLAFESEKEAIEFASSINRNENENYSNCYATGPFSISMDEKTRRKFKRVQENKQSEDSDFSLYTSDFSRLFKNINFGDVLPFENIGTIVGPDDRENYCKKAVDKINKFYHFNFVLDKFEHKNRNKENISKAIYVDSSNSRYWLTIGFNDSDNHVDFNCGIEGYEDFLKNIAETTLGL